MKFRVIQGFYALCRTLLITSVVSIVGCGDRPSYSNVDVETFSELIRSDNVTLLDVRTEEEFEKGHIEGAMLIDFRDSAFCERAINLLNPKDTIAVYCWSGGRSSAAAAVLAEEGFCVVNLKGGYKKFSNTTH